MNTVLRVAYVSERDTSRGHWRARTREPVHALIREMGLLYTSSVNNTNDNDIVITASGDRLDEMEEIGMLYFNPHNFIYTVSLEGCTTSA